MGEGGRTCVMGSRTAAPGLCPLWLSLGSLCGGEAECTVGHLSAAATSCHQQRRSGHKAGLWESHLLLTPQRWNSHPTPFLPQPLCLQSPPRGEDTETPLLRRKEPEEGVEGGEGLQGWEVRIPSHKLEAEGQEGGIEVDECVSWSC